MRLMLLGDPVDHSLSPAIQNAALRAASLPGTYEVRAVDESGLRAAFDDIRSGGIDGANVTMPHKSLAAVLCDELAPTARRAWAVNTLVRVGTAIIGHNTDVAGIRGAWADNDLPLDATVLVLGAGGAASAALLALEERDLAIAVRRPGAGAALAARVGVEAHEVPWGEAVSDASVVNCTPIGMHQELLPDRVIAAAGGLFDMAYGLRPTPSVTEARRRSLPVADGADMLIAQGAAAFRLWVGRAANTVAMRAALSRGSARSTGSQRFE